MNVLLVEDDAAIRRELCLRWRAMGWQVHDCDSLAALQGALAQAAPEVLVLDVELPDGNGLDWLRRWRKTDPTTPVILLTARDQVMQRVEGLGAGADDYLVKPFDPQELDARLASLLRRAGALQGRRIAFDRLLWLQDEGVARVDGQVLELQPREFETLGLLMRRAPRLVAKRALAEALAASNEEMGDSAVELYISRLRRKLREAGLNSVNIETARGFGYRLVATTESSAP